MNAQQMSDLKNELNNPTVTVFRSVFRDRDGYWAKEWPLVVDVYVQTGIATPTREYTLTPDEFKGLSRDQQRRIREAPSSPLP